MRQGQLNGLFALAIIVLFAVVVILTAQRQEMREVAEDAKRKTQVIAGYISKPPWLTMRRTHETLLWDLHVRVSELEGADADTVRVWETARAEE